MADKFFSDADDETIIISDRPGGETYLLCDMSSISKPIE